MALDMKGLFVNPAQLRQDRLDQLSARRAQLGTMGGSMAGLLGQVAGGGSILGEQLAEGIAGGLGLKTRQEKQAEQTQTAMKGINYGDPASIIRAADNLEKAGRGDVAQQLRMKASEVSASKSAARAAEKQQYIENALAFRKVRVEERNAKTAELNLARQQNLSAAQIKKLEKEVEALELDLDKNLALLPLEVRQAVAEVETAESQVRVATATEDDAIVKAGAEADSAVAAAAVSTATVSDQIAQVGANLRQTMAQTGLTEVEIGKTTQAMQQAAERHPAEMNKLLADVEGTVIANALNKAKTDRLRELTPFEVEAAMASIAKDEAMTEKLIKEASEKKTTDFLTEVNTLVDMGTITQEQAEQYIKERTINRARTGGIQGVGTAKISRVLGEVDKAHVTAQNSLEAMNLANKALSLAGQATTGILANERAFALKVASQLGYEGADETVFANQMIDLLNAKITLDQASALKGALSDNDLKFLIKAVGNRELSGQVMAEVFAELHIEKFAELTVSQTLENIVINTPESEIGSLNIQELRTKIYQEAQAEGRRRLADRGLL